MTDCKGAFAFGYEVDTAGTIAALSQYAGAKPKNKKKPSAGMTGGTAGGKRLNLVGIGCGDETPALALKETRRLMTQLRADIMIGPLSGDEAVSIANWAKQNRSKTVIIGTGRAGSDHADRAEEPLPLPRRRRPVERGPRGDRLQEARLEDGRADR